MRIENLFFLFSFLILPSSLNKILISCFFLLTLHFPKRPCATIFNKFIQYFIFIFIYFLFNILQFLNILGSIFYSLWISSFQYFTVSKYPWFNILLFLNILGSIFYSLWISSFQYFTVSKYPWFNILQFVNILISIFYSF